MIFIVLQFRTIFEIELTSNNLDEIGQKNTCKLLLNNQLNRDEFLQYTGIVQCNTGTTNVVRRSQDSSNMVISQCENSIKRMTTIDSSLKCSKNFRLFDWTVRYLSKIFFGLFKSFSNI